MAFHKKFEALLNLRPDVAVVQECAAPERLREKMRVFAPDVDPVWIGSNKNKGLGIFCFGDYRAEPAGCYDPNLRFVAPVRIKGPESFNLLAVWAQNNSDGARRKDRPGPVTTALQTYGSFLREAPVCVLGDFNNGVIWDKPGWPMNHVNAVEKLGEHGLVSAYHTLRNEEQGKETTPTHYWRDRRKNGPTYHIDYIFVPEGAVASVREFSVGSFEDWCGNKLSDHVPILIDVMVS